MQPSTKCIKCTLGTVSSQFKVLYCPRCRGGPEYEEAKREYKRFRDKEKRKNDIKYRITKNIRTRLHSAIKNGQKSGSAIRDLGCSVDFLKAYLEAKFKPEMSWGNYGEWHIDHIKPLAGFDLSDREQLLKLVHYTNLQPLWAKENIAKSDRKTA